VTRNAVIAGVAGLGLVVLSVTLYFFAVGQEATADIVGFQRTSDDRRIVVFIGTGLLTDVLERQVTEDASSVRVTVRIRAGKVVPAVRISLPVLVSLKDPLGERAVLDQNGVRVVDRGHFDLPSPARSP
jgi:hypothetical protein